MKEATTSGQIMDAAASKPRIRAMILVGVAYFAVGFVFALPSDHARAWRLATVPDKTIARRVKVKRTAEPRSLTAAKTPFKKETVSVTVEQNCSDSLPL
jgi:hypothetical protein